MQNAWQKPLPCVSYQILIVLVFTGSVFSVLLAKTEYYEISNAANNESDASTLANNIFKRFVYVPEIMGLINDDKSLASHLDTLRRKQKHMVSFELMGEALRSAFDIECHINQSKYWLEILEELWPLYAQGDKLPKNHYFPCQMAKVFGSNNGGLQYSELWSNVLSVDIFDAFKEIGFDNKDHIKEVFDKYRRIFLEPANLHSTNDKFRRFRGRNPSVNPFVKELGDN